jgi:hypothetical protein
MDNARWKMSSHESLESLQTQWRIMMIRALAVVACLALTAAVAFASGGMNRGDDPFDNPGGNPVIDSDGNIVGEIIPLQCVNLVPMPDSQNKWLCIY